MADTDKITRIQDHLAAEVQRLADSERRSFAAMVNILLEQALRLPDRQVHGVTRAELRAAASGGADVSASSPQGERSAPQSRVSPPEENVRTDFKEKK